MQIENEKAPQVSFLNRSGGYPNIRILSGSIIEATTSLVTLGSGLYLQAFLPRMLLASSLVRPSEESCARTQDNFFLSFRMNSSRRL